MKSSWQVKHYATRDEWLILATEPMPHDLMTLRETGRAENTKRPDILEMSESRWRRGWESNPRIKVLQTSPLPLGYRALLSKVALTAKKVHGAGER